MCLASEVIGSRRKDIIRLIISEGTRFPALAEFYYREVLSRVISALQRSCSVPMIVANCVITG